MQLSFQYAKITSAGPRPRNEDSLVVKNLGTDLLGVAVADGLGGRFGGDIASKKAVEMVFEDGSKAINNHAEVMLGIHESLISDQQDNKDLTGMATTLTYGVFSNGMLKGGHCGDTRIVLIRGKGIKKVTEDHTEVQRLLNANKLTKEEALKYPRRHVLDSALGGGEGPVFDSVELNILSGDRVLFSSDGVHDKILLRDLWAISNKSDTPEMFVSNVEGELVKRGPDDNYTLVCVDVE